jgi:UDP-GlcNAc:undecaprenyl-phosphate/decaprenyl-phosphate GlcNAc-1-phosphate transferase
MPCRVRRPPSRCPRPPACCSRPWPSAWATGTASSTIPRVLIAFLIVALTVAGELSRFWSLLALALALGAVGMLDDHHRLPASLRVAVEMGAGALLWTAGLGWSIFSSDAANLILTIAWVLALINAMNLLDLMDGVAATVAAVSSAGVGVLAGLQGDTRLAALAFAVAGACVGFLAHNLRSPARIYLGDGGTMAIGFVLAATIAALPLEPRAGWAALLGAIPLFGVPLFDIALRILLRLRRRIPLMTGGPDSVANWLKERLGSARRVAFALGAAQGVLCAVSIGALRLSDGAVVALAALSGATAVAAGKLITASPWAREADARARLARTGATAARVVVISSGDKDSYPRCTPTKGNW